MDSLESEVVGVGSEKMITSGRDMFTSLLCLCEVELVLATQPMKVKIPVKKMTIEIDFFISFPSNYFNITKGFYCDTSEETKKIS